ncbi:anthranilate synthase component I [Sulfolobus islandicus Y.G.57.14]|uniref:Anthranilate synthase component 1 n=1 Tax=Saccharolobus islandicus (strain Y.G.57.14 / Yellowstone \|nr:anthranilate synthase component I [Sulfolobus islandicus]ACP45589.1 anthranilate synthase component I [Sulfolobus islandicus Y.G.57.14]PVU78640.1 anthranilate synthase component I [Sulfolobus islandicus]
MEVHPINEFASPFEVFKCIERDFKVAGLLESIGGPQYKARYSVIAWSTNGYLKIHDDPVNILNSYLKDLKLVDIPGLFKGGMIGYISYDAVRFWEKIRDLKPAAEDWPYAEFFIPDNIIIYDHNEDKVYVNADLSSVGGCGDMGEFRISFYDESLNKNNYEKIVSESLEYIRSGYIFQVVLSRFYRYLFSGDPLRIYYNLRRINPSPYMFYLKFDEKYLIGSSPELLFRVQDNIVETYPIAGTRPRGSDQEEDLKLELELMNSEKDKAEHLMLVDLARNDLGKVCVPGTVRVPELMYVEKYSHVQHIVSKVIGTLKKKYNALNVLSATFPAGTVSGAPKPMAMNIIETLEEYKRGPYAGAVGFISADGNAEFAIAIRTAFLNKELLRIHAGAGIVYDSNPESEYFETEHKLKALKTAIGVS